MSDTKKLVNGILDDINNANVDISIILRKCKIVATQVKNNELQIWVERELNGYGNKEDLPDYRIHKTESYGDFISIAYHVKNRQIPSSCVPKEYREYVTTSYLMQPISHYASLLSEEGDTAAEVWPGNLVAQIGSNMIQGYTLTRAWKPLSKNAISSLIDIVRNRVLEYIIQIEPTIDGNDAVQQIKEPTEPMDIFNMMNFHPAIINASKSLFKTNHYAQAIFEAFKAVNNFVKDKTELPLDGKDLMAQVFKEDSPIIKLNELKTKSDRDEQAGFKFIFMGSMLGIRNPKAHENIIQTDPHRTLKYLGLASLLITIADQGKLMKSRSKNLKTKLRPRIDRTTNLK
ncbi:MAG: TIGR02391 family protein [Dehalococcoidia bacterium]|nr:TIGR02391 family protein [Dehalococcoidia bacterium]